MHVEKIKSNLFKRVLQISGYWSRGPRALNKKWLQSHSQLKCKTAPKQTGRWSVWSSQSSRPWGRRPFWGRSLIISVVNRYWGVAEFAIPKHASWGIDYFKLVICKKQKTEKEPLTLPITCLKERSYYLIVETKCGRQGESKQSVCLSIRLPPLFWVLQPEFVLHGFAFLICLWTGSSLFWNPILLSSLAQNGIEASSAQCAPGPPILRNPCMYIHNTSGRFLLLTCLRQFIYQSSQKNLEG